MITREAHRQARAAASLLGAAVAAAAVPFGELPVVDLATPPSPLPVVLAELRELRQGLGPVLESMTVWARKLDRLIDAMAAVETAEAVVAAAEVAAV